MGKSGLSVFLFLVIFFHAVVVRAETVNCTSITALPYTISTPGVYCLKNNLATNLTSGDAITIDSDNVVLDLNGHVIDGLTAGPDTETNGITLSNIATSHVNVTIKNGTVQGFLRGIWVNSSISPTNAIIENMRVSMSKYVGIRVNSGGNIIRNNVVANTGGNFSYITMGLRIMGDNNKVTDNEVIEVNVQGDSPVYGLQISGIGNVIGNNKVGNFALGTAPIYAIYIAGDSSFVTNNWLSTVDYGIFYAGGASGKYRDNLTFNVAVPFTGGIDAGNNN